MFENLSERLERSFKILKGQGKITEINVAETLKDVRRALLDADVSYKIAKTFCYLFLIFEHFLGLVELIGLILFEKLTIYMVLLKIIDATRIEHVLYSSDLLFFCMHIFIRHV